MSEITRIVALQEAAKLHKDADSIVKSANLFHDFLVAFSVVPTGTNAEAAAAVVKEGMAAAVKAAAVKAGIAKAPPAATKPAVKTAVKAGATKAPAKSEDQIVEEALAKAAAEKAAADAEEEAALMGEEEGSESAPATIDDVKVVVKKLLAANLREEAKGLFEKYEAVSASSLAAESYDDFVAEALALL